MKQIAIVGYSCRFPESNNGEEFWQLLINNESAITDLPASRLAHSNNKLTYLKKAGFLKNQIDQFDAKFFGISNREAPFMDPQQRLLLELTWEALENSHIDGNELKNELVGVFVGMWAADYNLLLRDSALVDTCEIHDAYLGTIMSAVAARISYFLKTSGPNLVLDAGCASSLNSLHYACESLNNFESNLAIAGGVNIVLGSRMGKPDSLILAPDGICKTYDKRADGFGRGDGIGILILKRLEDAERDNDNILGIVASTAVNCDGSGNNYGTPCKLGQARVMRSALQKGQLKASEISYVETHGTGTQIGDPIEINSLKTVFQHRLKIASVKTNIGHTEAAAGVASIIKVLLMFKHNKIPAHLNLKQLNPDIDLKNIEIVTKNEDFDGEYCGVSAFALSGHNAFVILKRPPQPNKNKEDPTKTEDKEEEEKTIALTLSAKSVEALDVVRLQFCQFLEGKILRDVAHTKNSFRSHFPWRILVTGNNSQQVIQKLQNSDFAKGCAKSDSSKTAFLFTDLNTKASQWFSHPLFEEIKSECISLLDCPLNDLLTNFITQFSLFQLWKSFGLVPDFVVGYGTGEYSAAAAAGILSLKDALDIVSQLKTSECQLVVAVKSNLTNVKNLIKDFQVTICSVNSPEEVAVVGASEVMKTFSDFCLKNGCKTRRIPNFGIYEKIENISIDTNSSEINFVSGSKGQLLGDNHFLFDEEYWTEILKTEINFSSAVQVLVESGCRSFIELGPHPVLLGHLMENLSPKIAQSSVWVPSLRNNEEPFVTLISSVAKLYLFGISFNWKQINQIDQQNAQRIHLPNYPFQRTTHWLEFKSN